VPNGDIWRQSAALSEFDRVFLNGLQRSVNRKVRSSNLRPGANFRIQNGLLTGMSGQAYYNRSAVDRWANLKTVSTVFEVAD
jgi:hypothetical protein